MYKGKKILALIVARSESKGLPGKNIRPLCRIPLIGWTIKQALGSKLLDKVVVSTDSLVIARIAKKYGAQVPFLRPKRLASDMAKSIDVVIHALQFFQKQNIRYDYLILLEPTSPLRETKDIDNSLKFLINNQAEASAIVSVSRVIFAHPSYVVSMDKNKFIFPYSPKFKINTRRQKLRELYFPEGTIYASKVNELIKRKTFYHKRSLAYIVPKWKSFEVDDIVDFICIEAMMNNLEKIKANSKDV